MTSRSDDRVAAELAAFVREYDACWSRLDFVGVSDLWEYSEPSPVYLGDEYAAPLQGADALEKHWARLSSRLKAAAVSTSVHTFDVLGDGTVRAVLLSRWRLTGRDSDAERAGASWLTWLLTRRTGRYRLFHHMEAQVYLPDE